MEIHKEQRHPYSIQSYSDQEIVVHDKTYQNNIIVSSTGVIESWPVVPPLDEQQLLPLLKLKPELILVACDKPTLTRPFFVNNPITHQVTSVECMSFGAAFRTFNVLLSEDRAVVLGVIFSDPNHDY